MARFGCIALGLCIFSVAACAQNDPLAWFPLQVGSRWIYEHEWKSGDRNRPVVDRWTTEEVITARVTIPEGIVVLRAVKQQGKPDEKTISVPIIGPNGELRRVQQPAHNRGVQSSREGEPYLVRENCIYRIGGGWDSPKQELRPLYRTYVTDAKLSPDFCFPLQMSSSWGTNDISWRVEQAREGVGSFLQAEYLGATHIFSSHFGSGGWMDVWFQKGVGVVGEHYIHNGTYDEGTTKLISFLPGLR